MLELVLQALALQRAPYETLQTLPGGLRLAFGVVFAAGVAQTLGQSVVLFAARVRPHRFVASLIVGAAVYLFGFLFLVVSIWLVARYGLGEAQGLRPVVRAVGLAYAPYLFSFIILTPYLGAFFSVALSLWSLSATLLALEITLGLTLGQALLCSVLGWLLLQLLQRTVGRPVQALARGLRRLTAGARLEFDAEKIRENVRRGREK